MELYSTKDKMNVPILMYHHIGNNGGKNNFFISMDVFDRQMNYMKSKGYQTVGFADINNFKIKRPFIITFDDGFDDVYSNAFPILKKYGFTATIFLVVDCIGKTNTWDDIYDRLLTVSQIKELLNNGFSIGSHTLSHPHLVKLDDKKCWNEIKNSKMVLEDKFGVKVKSFSYPYNEFNVNIKNIVMETGYSFACAISSKSKSVLADKFAIRRIYVKASDTMCDFKRKVSKLYLSYRGLFGK